ncbi:Hsp20/alpha crystallin family protein [Catellatospora citrea]|uniref:18 kDa antigen n=1 Tax=Catellatospora citrea TaxID=53366 RepID=A0A8J3KN83_9ACTN|nr:HSP20 family small heat-shock protein [Catellatospora citrea]RKE10500.1 HSP20 family protein [Catellatospora citrea]GIF98989.1 18 kDa antigen [Catellatospora citrea]
MIMRFDPFRDLDRLAGEAFGAARTPALMPMDCLRTADSIVVRFDMPGIDADSLDVSTENNTLTVRGERHRQDPDDATYLVSERPSGTYRRQLVLGDGLNLERVHADYRDGVLTLTIPVAEKAKPRKIHITRGDTSTAIGTHEGHRMIGGEAASREPATATA